MNISFYNKSYSIINTLGSKSEKNLSCVFEATCKLEDGSSIKVALKKLKKRIHFDNEILTLNHIYSFNKNRNYFNFPIESFILSTVNNSPIDLDTELETYLKENSYELDYYISFAYLSGINLEDYCIKFSFLPTSILENIVLQLIQSVRFLHECNVVHKDIKLANIMIDNGKIKLIDFGYAEIINKEKIIKRKPCGTRLFSSPEIYEYRQFIKDFNNDSNEEYIKKLYAGDIWSLGIVLFVLCNHKFPYGKIASLNEMIISQFLFNKKEIKSTHLSPLLNFIIHNMLDYDYEQRKIPLLI